MRVVLLSMEWKRRKGERREKKEELGKLLQAKPRWLIGWRDSAGLLTFESRISEARLA